MNLPYPEATELINKDLDAWKEEYDRVIGNGQEAIGSVLNSALDMVP
jgi:hypothetical protein